MSWAGRYVGIPWVDGGRDLRGLDCWGLVVAVMGNECGINLPSYGEISARDLVKVTSTIKTQADCDPWLEVEADELKEFDVVLMRGRPMHVGILTAKKMVLHVEEKTAAVMVPINHRSIGARVLGFRRHKDLTYAH